MMARYLTNKEPVDPVCGMKIDPTKAAATTSYKGSQIYFCALGRKNTFDANPQKFFSNRPKNFWSRYLDRLKKSTGGRPPSCCS
jgi:YHS domain-containing protein